MNVDLATVSLMTALVANVAGAVFVIDTVLRRDDGAGRIWAVAFLSGMATTIAYSMWAAGLGGPIAIAVGNALFVNTTGCMWLGSRAFNQRRLVIAAPFVVFVDLLVAAAVLVEGAEGGDWAGWLTMGLSLVAFSVCAAAETLRRPMGRIGTAWVLSAVFVVEAGFYLVRSVVFVVAGAESEYFLTWFGSTVANYVTVVLTIVAVVVLSVLRAARADLRGYAWMSQVGVTTDGIMLAPTFRSALNDVVERASWRSEIVAVLSVRVEDLVQIRTAFGADIVGDVIHAWRQGVRRFAPSTGLVGEDGDDGLLVVTRSATAADARRQAAAVYRGLFESFAAVTSAVIPAVGVGVALTETVGYDPQTLLLAAREASAKAATSIESSVLFGGTGAVIDDLA
ncbi:diguanylate cyclase [Microbacterium sp. 18062]|uniref:diguanylate cyclase n=1 Tax=Microbacterium sp. 18062 TaxID=2681410 RepID=UPI00135899C2|nr:diguanylate cyclase [Microbacterium sp. 18062]